jgi:hypothetical protein
LFDIVGLNYELIATVRNVGPRVLLGGGEQLPAFVNEENPGIVDVGVSPAYR